MKVTIVNQIIESTFRTLQEFGYPTLDKPYKVLMNEAMVIMFETTLENASFSKQQIKEVMEELTKRAKKEFDLAYENGKPLISDEQYDKIFGVNNTGKILDDNSAWEKFTHTIPMASLNKVDVITADNKVTFNEVENWMAKVANSKSEFVVTLKYDGAAIALYYEEGKFVRAVTRGDGNIGEDVTRNVLKADNLIKKVPKNIKVLIAEIIIPKDTFEKKLKDTYANPRNGGAGALKDFSGKNAKYLTLCYHGVEYTNKKESEYESLQTLKNLGAKHIEFYLVNTFQGLTKCYNDLLKKKEQGKLNFEADGIVLTVNSGKEQRRLGRDPSNNPKYKIAVKFPYPRKTTKIKNIIWSMGKTGVITPIAVVKNVDLGVNVTKASLANLDEIERLWGKRGPKKGDIVEVSRRGDVIPKIEKVVKKIKGMPLLKPPHCPMCEGDTVVDGPFLVCANLKCDSRKLGDLYKWCDTIKNHFKVKGIGPERVFQMYEAGLIKEPADLYKLKPKDLINKIEGVKERAADNILAFQQHKNIPLDVFLGGLNIPSIGQSIFGFIIDEGYETLEEIKKLNETDLASINNLGSIRAKTIIKWLKYKEKTIEKLIDVGIKLESPEEVELESESLSGKSFLFTGALSKPRDFFQELVVKNGGEVKGSVSKNLDYLVVGDAPGSKLQKAQSLNVKVLNEKQFLSMIQS